jgi:tRNA modification GTPase
MGGEASQRLQAITTDLETLRADLEARIDFPEDLEQEASLADLQGGMARLRQEVEALARSAARGRHARSGLRVVLVGPPNAGKSLLFNRLLGSDRALVSPEAGTTRDAIGAELALDGVVLSLCDTAGLRQTTATLEAAGVQKARAELASADVWLFVGAPDVAHEADALRQELRATRPEGVVLIEVENKSDLLPGHSPVPAPPSEALPACPEGARLKVSALLGTGLVELEARLRALAADLDTGAVGLVQARHATALEELTARLREAEELLAAGEGSELAAEALRGAAAALDRLFGRHADPEALLGEIFGRFCIGK